MKKDFVEEGRRDTAVSSEATEKLTGGLRPMSCHVCVTIPSRFHIASEQT